MIDLTTAFAVSISEGNARLSIFVAEHIYQSVLRHRVGKLTAGLRVGRSSNIVPKPLPAGVGMGCGGYGRASIIPGLAGAEAIMWK